MWRLKPRSHRIRSTTKIVQSTLNLLREFECPENKGARKLIYLAVAGASDFPHSRHDVFDRGVISPQNGHILCDA